MLHVVAQCVAQPVRGWLSDVELHHLVFDLLGFSLDLNLSFLPVPGSSLSKWDCLLYEVCWNHVTVWFYLEFRSMSLSFKRDFGS